MLGTPSYAANGGVADRAGISPLRGSVAQTDVTLLSGQWPEVEGHCNNGRHPRC